MGAKFTEFMRIEKRSSVCVIYQRDQDKQIHFCVRKISPGFPHKLFGVRSGKCGS